MAFMDERDHEEEQYWTDHVNGDVEDATVAIRDTPEYEAARRIVDTVDTEPLRAVSHAYTVAGCRSDDPMVLAVRDSLKIRAAEL